MKGIDISVHNGEVNVKQVRDSGYEWIIARAGYGKNNIDQRFERNAIAMLNLLVNSGIYWFSYALSLEMARQEALYAIKCASKYWQKCPIAFDLEYDTVRYARTKGVNIDKALATNMAIVFLKEVVSAGYIPVLYTNKDYLKNYFDVEKIKKEIPGFFIWYARYTTKLTDSELEFADIWQKSSTGKVTGISGDVDLNEFYTDFSAESKPVKKEETTNINILNFQKSANADGYRDASGKELVEDGKDGTKTQFVRKQIVLKAKTNSKGGYTIGSTGEVVKWWQTRLNELGFKTDIDGKYGADTRKKTMSMQEKYNLVVDGKAGYNTLSTAFYV